MVPENISPDVDEREKHISAIASLSEIHRIPADTVTELYERELAHIREDALITIYLPIFVTRRVNEMLRSLSAPGASASGERFLDRAH